MGYMSLFFGIILFSQALFMMQHAQELLKLAQFPPQMKNVDAVGFIRGTGIFMVIFSLCVILNVILNLRFLKLYMSVNNDEIK
jgi:hypothetical protein